jgi:hypothetical protein
VERLLQRGYTAAGAEAVVVHAEPFDAPIPLHCISIIGQSDWPEVQLHATGAPESPEWRLMTLASARARVRDAVHIGVLDNSGAWIACAEVFPVGDIALFANDATLQSARGRGAQTALIHHRLRVIAAGRFCCVVAEVAPESTSERNYFRCGFQLCYTRRIMLFA